MSNFWLLRAVKKRAALSDVIRWERDLCRLVQGMRAAHDSCKTPETRQRKSQTLQLELLCGEPPSLGCWRAPTPRDCPWGWLSHSVSFPFLDSSGTPLECWAFQSPSELEITHPHAKGCEAGIQRKIRIPHYHVGNGGSCGPSPPSPGQASLLLPEPLCDWLSIAAKGNSFPPWYYWGGEKCGR